MPMRQTRGGAQAAGVVPNAPGARIAARTASRSAEDGSLVGNPERIAVPSA